MTTPLDAHQAAITAYQVRNKVACDADNVVIAGYAIQNQAARKAAREAYEIESEISRKNRNARHAREVVERQGLASSLAAWYLNDGPRKDGFAERIFEQAWREGHASGDDAVEAIYISLATLINDAYSAGAESATA